MKTFKTLQDALASRTEDNMVLVAERLNDIEPEAGLQTFHNADFLPVLGTLGVIILGAIFISNAFMGYFAYKRAKNRLF